MEPSASPSQPTLAAPGLKNFLRDVWTARAWIIPSTLASGAIAALVIVLTPARYAATATFVLPTSSGSLNPLASLAIFSKESSPLSVIYGVAASNEAYRIISEKTGRSMVELKANLTWEMDSVSNQISARSEYESKPRAIAVCQTATAVLQQMSTDLATRLARENLGTLDPTVKVRQTELKEAEEALLAYIKTLKTAPDPSQPMSAGVYLARLKETEIQLGSVEKQLEFARQAAIRRGEPQTVVASLTGSMPPSWKQLVTQVEYDLRLAETRLGPSAPEVETLRRKLEVTRSQAQTEIAKYIQSVETNVDTQIADLVSKKLVLEWQREQQMKLAQIAPQEGIELQRLIREMAGRAELLRTLRAQTEATRIQADSYQLPFTLLQPATLDPTPTNKSMGKPVIISAILGFLISSLCVIGLGKKQK